MTRPALGLAANGPLGCHGNHCAPMLAAAVSRERAQGNCWHDRMVWAAFLPQVQALHVSVALVQCPGANFGPRGLCVMVVSGAQFRSGLATNVMCGLPEKVKCG